ncbi:hypothetical protein IGI04_002434 [Brassica rapa subsp. trilocularis]|uniref:Peptidase A2 domain-containing protein n=1 Tax=Brassica rapa subsp. trilocularis TaxID=1813537 RepID=A0ABQ7NVI4_BRACM|nr:hypothetical protein IGI04_002434 [Brassica rapa subsp. trilocularis]
MRISADDRYQEMPRHMKINIDRCRDIRHATFGFSRLKTQGQAKLPKCPDECMPSGTRSNKEKDLLFSDDPAHLECTIRRGQRSTSLDATTSSSIDTHNQPSTDTRPSSSIDPNRSTMIDITPRTSIDTVSSKMVNIIILTHDEIGNLYDQAGHLRNATGQKMDAQGTLIPDADATGAAQPERDFEIESSMSLGRSQWCRPMSMNSHQSTDHDEDRWTDYSSRRSTSSAESTDCNAVRILTHEEFAAKHPHPPSPFYDKIDRSVEPTIDRQSESGIDRNNPPPINRRAPLTYRVRLPSIDNDYINALRPPPKPLTNPPEPKPNPLNSSPEPVQENQETKGRVLRRRKEKIPKNLKREANDKEMDGFTKRVLRIPIEKPFDEAYFTHRITLTKKSDPGKFAIPCVVKGVEFLHSTCDTGASVSIFPRIMADQLGLTIEPSTESFTFVDLSEKRSGGMIRDLEVINSVDYGEELGFIGACHCGAEYESEYKTEYSESIDTPTFPSIDSNESTVTDDRKNTSLDVKHPVDHFAPPNHCSWADSGFHESFAVDTVITSSNEEHTEEYDEDYWKERAIEMSLQDERFETHEFTNTFPTSFDAVHSTSVDTLPRPAKQPLTSIDTHTGTSIDIRAAAKIQEQENIPSPTRFRNTYINRFAPLKPPTHTRADTQAKKMNTLPSTSTGKFMKSNHLKNTSSKEITLPSIDASVSTSIDTTLNPNLSISKLNDNAKIDYGFLTPDEFGIFRNTDGNARAMDERILQVSREDIADILQVANGPDKLFSQQRGTPDVIQTDPNNHVGVAQQKSIQIYHANQKGKHRSTEQLRHRSAGKFTWEQRDEYGVYRDECGHARGVAGEMIPVTRDDIRKLLERASLFEESHICLPEHATSFTLTRLAPELYTKDEINEMVFGICGAQEKLSLQQCSAQHKDEWEASYIDTRINDVYCPLNNNVDWLSTKIELLQQDLDTIRKKDQQPATSIDMCTFTSLDTKVSAMNERLRTYEDMHDRFISPVKSSSINRLRGPWIDGKKPLELLPYKAAEVDKITSKIYTAIDTMEERFDKHCDDIYFPFDNKISGLDSHAEWLQKEVKAIQRQLAAQHQISASIDRTRAKSIDGNSPRSTNEHLIASIDTEPTLVGDQLIHKTIDSMQNELT